MPTKYELRTAAWSKFRSAKDLLNQKKYDDAAYLCGYAVEMLLKARILVDHGFSKLPANPTEFKTSAFKKAGWDKQDIFSHDLEHLLNKTKVAGTIKGSFLREWSSCVQWNPETRYQPVGTATKEAAIQLIADASKILRQLSDSPGLELADGRVSNPYVKIGLIADELMEVHGDFDMFAIWHRAGSFPHSADVVVAAPWIDGDPAGSKYVCDAINAKLTAEELKSVAAVIQLNKHHPVLRAIRQLPFNLTYTDIQNINLNGIPIDNATFVRLKGETVD